MVRDDTNHGAGFFVEISKPVVRDTNLGAGSGLKVVRDDTNHGEPRRSNSSSVIRVSSSSLADTLNFIILREYVEIIEIFSLNPQPQNCQL